MKHLKNVSVAILSCNRKEDLKITLDQLLAEGAIWHEVIVADNASSDGSVQMLKEAYPEVRVIALKENRGVKGLNAALLSATGEWVLSLDDDSCPVLGTLAGVADVVTCGEGYDTITCSVRKSGAEIGAEISSGGVTPYYGLHQAGSFVRRELLNELSGYDESLFLWGVELDFCARALLKGARLGKCDSAVVEHRCTPANRSSSRHAFFYTRNLLTFVKRYAPVEHKRSLLRSYLANVIMYSVLHRTTVYWSGVQASRNWAVCSETALPDELFEKMGADLRLPFSFLG